MCTIDTNKIFLTWRKDVNKSRYIIGILSRQDDSYSFEYIVDNVKIAQKKENFSFYQPFQDINKIYNENVLDFFKRRLLNPQRRDYEDFLNYWGALEYKDDVFSLLGLTGAKLLTDNFEFIAPHKEIPAKFNTEISWLNTKSQTLVDTIRAMTKEEVEKKLSLKPEPDNSFDNKAVQVLFDNEKLGYIKSIHCENVFDAILSNKQIDLKVANIIKNGTIKEVLLKISIT